MTDALSPGARTSPDARAMCRWIFYYGEEVCIAKLIFGCTHGFGDDVARARAPALLSRVEFPPRAVPFSTTGKRMRWRRALPNASPPLPPVPPPSPPLSVSRARGYTPGCELNHNRNHPVNVHGCGIGWYACGEVRARG